MTIVRVLLILEFPLWSCTPGSAHLTTMDAPEAFADSVARFLKDVERR